MMWMREAGLIKNPKLNIGFKLDCHSQKKENTSPESFFQIVYNIFQQTEKTAGKPIELFYDIAGFKVCLRFAGKALISLITPALEHLAAGSGSTPSLTICLFDSISTSARMPLFPWPKAKYWQRKPLGGSEAGPIKTDFDIARGVLSLLDTKSNLAIYWVKDTKSIPYYETGSPMLVILHWWMLSHGRQLAHGGAVGTDKGGVFLAGRGGSGKSTVALSSLDSELSFAGDDYCLFSSSGKPFIYSLYNSAKIDQKHMHSLLAHMVDKVSNKEYLDFQKALFFLYKYFPNKIIKSFPCKAILLPQVSGLRETRLKKISSAFVLKSLAPSTIFQLLGGERDFKNFIGFVRQLPCYLLETGTDLSRIPPVISGLLSELGI